MSMVQVDLNDPFSDSFSSPEIQTDNIESLSKFGGILSTPEAFQFFRRQRAQRNDHDTNFLLFTACPYEGHGQTITPYRPESSQAGNDTGTASDTEPVTDAPSETNVRQVSERVLAARREFLESMRGVYPGATAEELEALCRKFEERMMRLGQARSFARGSTTDGYRNIEDMLVNSYSTLGQLASLSSGQPNELYNREGRARLATNLLYYAANPGDQDQGPNGSCWNISGRVLGMISCPDLMIDYASQLALTGAYRSPVTGASFVLSPWQRQNLMITQRMQEATWNINNAPHTGTRSPAGLLFDRSLSYMIGRRHEHSGTYQQIRDALQIITGRTVPHGPDLTESQRRQALMEWGGFIEFVRGFRSGHMRTNQLVYQDGRWFVRRDDQHGPHGDYNLYQVPGLSAWLRGIDRSHLPPGVRLNQPPDTAPRFIPRPCPDDNFCPPQPDDNFHRPRLRLIFNRCFQRRIFRRR